MKREVTFRVVYSHYDHYNQMAGERRVVQNQSKSEDL